MPAGGGRRGFHAAAPATGRAGSCERRQRSDRAGRESEGRGGPRVAAGQVRRGGVSISRAGGRRRDRRGRTEGREEPKAALFQSVDAAGRRLTGRALQRRVVLAMIKRRPAAAGRPPSTCCNTFRATGITAYSVERRDPRARAADRGARVPEDNEALRPDHGHDHRRRDRADRDLRGAHTSRRRRQGTRHAWSDGGG